MLGLSLVLAGCGGGGSQPPEGGSAEEQPSGGESSGGGESTGGGAASGEIAIEGSSTVLPISQAAATGFSEENPDAKISVGGAGTGDGFEAFCAGDVQIADASRPIEAEEIAACEEAGVEFIEVPVAFDGISVVVNTENDFAQETTSEELKAMWEPAATDTVLTWTQVNPEYPEEDLVLFGPGSESGTYDYFAEEIADPDSEEPALREDYEASEDDNVLVEGVAGEATTLGFFGFSYYDENKDTLRALPLDGVEPTVDTIADGSYPLSRPLFIYVSTKALDENPAVEPFVTYYLENANTLVEEADYVPLPDSTLQESQTQFMDRTTGTLYDESGELSGGDLETSLKDSQ